MAKPTSLCPAQISLGAKSFAAAMPIYLYFSPWTTVIRLSVLPVSLFLNMMGRPSLVALPETMTDVQLQPCSAVNKKANTATVKKNILPTKLFFIKDLLYIDIQTPIRHNNCIYGGVSKRRALFFLSTKPRLSQARALL